MPNGMGGIGLGIADAFNNYINSERTRRRAMEDQQIDQQMELIKTLAQSPNFNPNLMGKALHDLVDLHTAKVAPKLKGGVQGMLGSHELPMSQLLTGISSGMTPTIGETYQDVPDPSRATASNIPSFDSSAGIPAMPTHIPTVRIDNPNQPLFKSPKQMNEEAEAADIAKARGGAVGKVQGELSVLDDPRIAASGALTAQDRADLTRKAMGLPALRRFARQEVKYRLADGSTLTAELDPQTGQHYDETNPNTMISVPQGAQRIGLGPVRRFSASTDDFGTVHIYAEDPYADAGDTTAVQSVPTPPGVKGRTSPAGPAVTGEDASGAPFMGRFSRTGTVATPATIGAPAGATAPAGAIPQPPAPGQAPTAAAPKAQPQSSTAQPANNLVKLNEQELTLTNTIRQSAPMIQRMMDILQSVPNEDNLVQGGQSVLSNAYQRGRYQFHLDPTDEYHRQLIPLAELMKVFTGQQYLHGVRNEHYINQIQSHLPDALDTPELLRSKLANLIPAMKDFMRSYNLESPAELDAVGGALAPSIPAPPAAGAPTSRYKKTRVQ